MIEIWVFNYPAAYVQAPFLPVLLWIENAAELYFCTR